MLSLLFSILLAANLGPMGPDAPAHEPHLATNGSTVVLTFGAGKNICYGKTFSTPVTVD